MKIKKEGSEEIFVTADNIGKRIREEEFLVK